MSFEQTQLFDSKPSHLNNPLIVAGAVIVHNNKLLLLRRHPDKPYGLHWNLPAGKILDNEDPQLGAQREIFEETGIFIPLEDLRPIKTFYIQRGSLYIEFHVYKTHFHVEPEIKLKLDENTEALWTSLQEASQLKLLGGGQEILDFCFYK